MRLKSVTIQKLPALLVVLGVAGVGAWLIGTSHAAAPNDPLGVADYCTLENNATVIHGWAHDTDAPAGPLPNVIVKVGATSLTVPSNIANYRQAAIDANTTSFYPGVALSSIYGWRAVFPGLYKGTKNTITGTLVNVGTGVNTGLGINTGNPLTGDFPGGITYFVGSIVPDVCLGIKPLPPLPIPAPTPPPTPAPVPAPVAKPNPVPVIRIAPTPTPKPPLSGDADAVPFTGSLATQITIPVGNATKVHIVYGTTPILLDRSTPDQPTNGAPVVVALTGLQASTTYYYEIIRSDDSGSSVTSGAASFKTQGFTLVVHFVNNKSIGIEGVAGSVAELKLNGTSDKNGLLQFSPVPGGSYEIGFTYQGKVHKLPVTADGNGVSNDDAPKTSELPIHYFINVDSLAASQKASVTTPQHRSYLSSILGLLGVFLILIMIFIVRRRTTASQQLATALATTADVPAKPPVTSVPATALPDYDAEDVNPKSVAVPVPALGHLPLSTPPLDGPEHMGESLRQMVIDAMWAENHPQVPAPPTPPLAPLPEPPSIHAAPHPVIVTPATTAGKQPIVTPADDEVADNPLAPDPSAGPVPRHMGESLGHMVAESMRDEQAHKKDTNKP